MSIFFVPALIGFLLKSFILVHAFKGGKVSTILLSLIGVFAIHNGIEIFGYFEYTKENNNIVSIVFRLYYVATIYVLLYILLHALSITKLESKRSTISLITTAGILSYLILFSDHIIAGELSIGYTMTAIKGSLYGLFTIYVLITLISSALILLYLYKRTDEALMKARCLCSLTALAPVIAAFIVAVIFKTLNININGTGMIPIATTLFAIIILRTEGHHKLSKIKHLMPLSIERETTANFMSTLSYYMEHKNEKDVFKTVQNDIEREIIFYSLKKCNYNVSHTTSMMGLKNRSTLYSMMNRLDIDIKEIKKV